MVKDLRRNDLYINYWKIKIEHPIINYYLLQEINEENNVFNKIDGTIILYHDISNIIGNNFELELDFNQSYYILNKCFLDKNSVLLNSLNYLQDISEETNRDLFLESKNKFDILAEHLTFNKNFKEIVRDKKFKREILYLLKKNIINFYNVTKIEDIIINSN